MTGDHQNRITDYTGVVLMSIEARHDEPRCYEDEASPAVIARAGTGGATLRSYCFRKTCKPGKEHDGERWIADGITNTLNGYEFHSNVRTPEIILQRTRDL